MALVWIAGGVLSALLGWLVWLVVVEQAYTAGSDLGYNLGLAGGLLMLSLLLYPLRKRVRALERLGEMTSWFKYHMVAGVLGPLLIMFHSTFQTHSMNGRVALYSMLLVMISGLVGRFVYRHVHRGLYGKRLTLEDVERELNKSNDNMRSVFVMRPDIEVRLQAFRREANAPNRSALQKTWQFVTLRHRGRVIARSVCADARKALRKQAKTDAKAEGEVNRMAVRLNYLLAKQGIEAYVEAIVDAVQLSVWEKLFSLWHLVHVPFLYLLLVSGIVHVIAVHMY
ncbi:hypothetical protein GCM10025771_29290 [Niveibacterium umoris]|uniref:Uncharacterized protein n=1 Tax=Niveibacterium umoris TaxID=1193620 RepID=A0A840BJV9_9RHOO|nr:hypothetical protein [Niveibacterium umoris]MBB4011878.1 hypothetical protein [Niveibacterium umoris]